MNSLQYDLPNNENHTTCPILIIKLRMLMQIRIFISTNKKKIESK